MGYGSPRPAFARKLSGMMNPWQSNRSADLQRNLLFCIYPDKGTAFDIVKSRNSDSASAVSGMIWSQSSQGHPGFNATASKVLWSVSNTTDISPPTFGVGVTGGWSFWLWIYVRAISSGVNDFCDIIGRYNYVSETNNQGWLFQKQPHNPGSDGTPRLGVDFFRNDGFANYKMVDTSQALSAGQYNNYVALLGYDSSGGVGSRELYRDGVSRTAPIGNGFTVNTTNGVNVLGAAGSNDIVLLGAAIWNRSLTASEINLLYEFPEVLMNIQQRQILRPVVDVPESASDSYTLSDAMVRTLGYSFPLSDSVSLSDFIQLLNGLTFSDAISLIDTLGRTKGDFLGLEDILTFTDGLGFSLNHRVGDAIDLQDDAVIAVITNYKNRLPMHLFMSGLKGPM